MSTISKRLMVMLSFVIPLGVMVGCMIAYGVQPFGKYSLVIIDGLHQYMPFFSILYDKLKGHESLFYTYRAGLGINFLSLISYYLSSPMNLAILFFKKTQLNMAVSMLIALKIALSGLFAGIWFSSRLKKADPIIVVASVAYALNSYMVGYCWNVMWLDAIMVLPLIIYGIERLIQKGDGRVYCLSLFYALYCNYYIGFMICIFSVLWFLFNSFRSADHFAVRGVQFFWNSLLAGGLAAVLLIPAYLGIRQTASGSETSIPGHAFVTSFANLFNRQIALASPISNDNFDGNINSYIGLFTLAVVLLYFLNEEIAFTRKCKYALLMAFFYVSFSEKILNYIWHGFHDQFGIPNRFSFLFGFVALTMVVEEWRYITGLKAWHTAVAALVCTGLVICVYHFGTNRLEGRYYLIDAGLLAGYFAILLLSALAKRRKDLYRLAFCAVAVTEMCATAVVGFSAIGQIDVPKFFSGTQDMERAVTDLDDGTFYRSDLADTLMVDESAWYRLRSVGLFGSTAPGSMVDAMDNLGFYTGCNEYLYKGASPITNMLFGVRYIYFHGADTLQTEFEPAGEYGEFSAYENPAEKLSIGYMMDTDVDLWESYSDYPFYVQNSLCKTAFGIEDMFRTFTIQDPVTDSCTASKTNAGEYYFEYEKESTRHMIFTIPVNRNIKSFYIHYDGTQVDNAEIAVDGQIVCSGDVDGQIVPVGRIRKGETVTVTMALKGEEETGYVRLSAADLDWDAYRKLVRMAQARAFRIRSFTDRSLTGMVTAQDDQLMFLSLPYDEGWKVKVDDEVVETEPIGEAFLGVPMDKGDHYVELVYTPPGFRPGLAISLASVLLFFAGWAFRRRAVRGRHRKKT